MKQILLQAVAYAKGEADTGRYRVHVPEQQGRDRGPSRGPVAA